MLQKISNLPRGIRNNNPGNIRHGAAKWEGRAELQDDPAFVVFQTPLYGLRALMKVLLSYYYRHGLDNVQSIINRWAPPCENATDSYAYFVARALNVKRFDRLRVDQRKTLINLAKAIVLHENGRPSKEHRLHYPAAWYAPVLFEQAAELAVKP